MRAVVAIRQSGSDYGRRISGRSSAICAHLIQAYREFMLLMHENLNPLADDTDDAHTTNQESMVCTEGLPVQSRPNQNQTTLLRGSDSDYMIWATTIRVGRGTLALTFPASL